MLHERKHISYGTGINCSWIEKKAIKAKELIYQWLQVCNYKAYLSISGGKDSLVAAHLAVQVWQDIPLVWVNQGYLAEWEECISLLELLKTQYSWNIQERCPPRGLLQLYQDYGLPLEGTMNTKQDKIINQKLIYNTLEEYQEINQIEGYAWGLRKESKGRAAYLKTHGLLYQLKCNGLWVCSPVGYWTTQDIWDYIDYYQLPYASIYDLDRYTVRNGCPIGTTGVSQGRLAFLKIHYPDIFNEFVKFFPEIALYG